MPYTNKNILFVSLIWFLCSSQYSSAHNISYQESIIHSAQIQEYNTNYNIQKAKLLEDYVNSLTEEIYNFKEEHYITSNDLEGRISELKAMSRTLREIQTFSTEKHHAESITQSVIDNIKILKQELKILLENKLIDSMTKLREEKARKSARANQISKRFISFVSVFTPKVRKLSNITKKKLILSSLTNINKEASKLALLETRTFTSQKQLDDYYGNAIRSIKRELNTIRAIISQ